MRTWKPLLTGLALGLATTLGAHAQSIVASARIALYAGPADNFPVVIVLNTGAPLQLHGCLSNYQWCDVSAGPYRGWAPGGYLLHHHDGHAVPVFPMGASIGIRLLDFNLFAYWDDHYRDRRWYPERQDWLRRLPPPPAAHAPLLPGLRPDHRVVPPPGHLHPAPPPHARPAPPRPHPVHPAHPAHPAHPDRPGTGAEGRHPHGR